MGHTKQFKNWVDELLTEEEGQSIAREGVVHLELLYERCTGKSPMKPLTSKNKKVLDVKGNKLKKQKNG